MNNRNQKIFLYIQIYKITKGLVINEYILCTTCVQKFFFFKNWHGNIFDLFLQFCQNHYFLISVKIFCSIPYPTWWSIQPPTHLWHHSATSLFFTSIEVCERRAPSSISRNTLARIFWKLGFSAACFSHQCCISFQCISPQGGEDDDDGDDVDKYVGMQQAVTTCPWLARTTCRWWCVRPASEESMILCSVDSWYCEVGLDNCKASLKSPYILQFCCRKLEIEL